MQNGAQQRIPKLMEFEKIDCNQILKIAFGRRHCVMLTVDGKIYSWGDNTYGETAHSSQKFIKSPVQVII